MTKHVCTKSFELCYLDESGQPDENNLMDDCILDGQELCREEEREKIKSIHEIGLEQPEITSIEAAIEDIERCSKEALEPYIGCTIAGMKKREHAYRNKALELACKVFNEYGECPGDCSWCHLGDKTLNKCDKVIDYVDGCINH